MKALPAVKPPPKLSPRAVQILDTAARLFHERGFAAVSIDEIGALCGVSGPAIYRHFRSKADILVAIFDVTIKRLIRYVGDVRNSPSEELDALLAGQARLAVRHPELVRVFETEEGALPPALRREFRRRQKAHAARWVHALSSLNPDRNPAELEVLAYSAIGLLLSVPRWPKGTRAYPGLETALVAAARRALTP